MAFWCYMLHCRGGVFYTGHTDDLERRMAQHQSGLIRGFTQDLHPLELVWSQDFQTRYEAISAETRIKGWSKRKKLALIRGDWETIARLAKGKDGPSTNSGRTGLGVRDLVLATVIAEAARVHPEEVCGLLLGTGSEITWAVVCINVHPTPRTHFEIDPSALIAANKAARAGGPELLGYYHSHPIGSTTPSATDRADASHDGKVWAIVAGGEVRFWRDLADGFEPLSSRVVAG